MTDKVQRPERWNNGVSADYYYCSGIDPIIAKLETELRDVVFIYECDKCAFIANPEHVGQKCRLCGGSVKRIATSVEAERGAVIASNRINQLCSEAKALKSLHASIIDQGRKVLNATSEIGMSHAEYIEWVMERLEGNDSTLAAHPSPI